jgi:Prokaryotic N-terminal methylation motif
MAFRTAATIGPKKAGLCCGLGVNRRCVMIEPSRRKGRTAGFSLAEALVALVIAALLVAVLTRFVSGTRANATKIHDEIALELASDSLLEHFVAPTTVPSRMDGRSGSFTWRIDVAPIVFTVNPEVISKPVVAAGDQAKGLGSAATSEALSPYDIGYGAASQTNQANAKPKLVWTPYHVTAVVNASSGRNYAIDTIRIVPQKPDPRSEPEKH